MSGALSRLSIRLTAPVLLALPMLLAAIVLIVINGIQGRAAVERLASQQLEQIHDQIGRHVDVLVALPGQVTRGLNAFIDSGRLDPNELRGWSDVLIEQFLAFERLSAITWGGEDGNCTWIARYTGDDERLYYAIKDAATGDEIVEYHVSLDGVVDEEPAGRFAFDPTTRPWYLAPKRAGRAAWSEPFLWVGGSDEEQPTLGIAYGRPWFGEQNDSGQRELIGVIDADLSLQDISRFLSGLRIGRTGRSFVVDDASLLLASSTSAAVADGAGERLLASASEQHWIGASARELASAFGSVGEVDRAHDGIVTVDGVREWLRATPFVHASGLQWVVVTLVPEADFMAEIAAGRRRSAWFTAGVTLATLAFGVLVAMIMVRPIVTLSQHVRRLGEGDFDQTINLQHASELVALSDDMNQMAADLRDRMELRRSLALAMEVQQSLLPSETPSVDGLDIYGHSTYCDETGGDYYDYLEVTGLSDNTTALAVGDVMGHGIAAAMLMATARGILRSRCTEIGSLGALMAHLNDLLVEVTGGTRFMTMVLMTIDGTSGQVRLASAGHDPPFIYDAQRKDFVELEEGGLPLGIVAGEKYVEIAHGPLSPGSILIASTDGIWEAQNAADEQYGKDRVRAVIRANADRTASEIGDALRASVEEFCGDARQLDDITFVVVRRVAV